MRRSSTELSESMRAAAEEARQMELEAARAAEATPEQRRAWKAAEARERQSAQAAAMEQTIAAQVARVERRVSRAFPTGSRHASIALPHGASIGTGEGGRQQRPFSRGDYATLAQSGAIEAAAARAAEWGVHDPRKAPENQLLLHHNRNSSSSSSSSNRKMSSSMYASGSGSSGGVPRRKVSSLNPGSNGAFALSSRRRSTRAIVMNIIGGSVLALEHQASEAARIASGEIDLMAEAQQQQALRVRSTGGDAPPMGVYRVAEHSSDSEASSSDDDD